MISRHLAFGGMLCNAYQRLGEMQISEYQPAYNDVYRRTDSTSN